MIRRQPISKIGFFLLSLYLLSCSSSHSNDLACQNDSDCFQGEVCFYGICHTRCQTDADCQAGYVCSNGICTEQSDAGDNDAGNQDDLGETDTGSDSEIETDSSGDSGCSPPCNAGNWCNEGSCELCNTAGHCGLDCEACSGGTSVCSGVDEGCVCDASSCGSGRWCNSSGGCEDCNTDGHCGQTCQDCAESSLSCDVTHGSCVCLSDSQCNAVTEFCSEDQSCVLHGQYQWHTFFGSGNDDNARNLTADSTGNIYITGDSLGPWNGSLNGDFPRNAHSGGKDIFVMKLNGSGDYQWHTFFGAANNASGDGIVLDNGGNIYVTGNSDKTFNGSASGGFPRNAHSGGKDIFVMKLAGNGSYCWHTFHGAGPGIDDSGWGIVLDNGGNIYVTGESRGAWNGSTGQLPRHLYGGGWEVFVLNLNGSGDYQWHTFFGPTSSGMVIGRSIGLDNGGNIYITGDSTVTWNGSTSGGEPLHSYTASWDIFVMKLNGSGDYQWHTFYGSAKADQVFNIAMDNSTNIYVAGHSYAAWNGPAGQSPRHEFNGTDMANILVMKLNGSGDYQWHTFYGVATDTHGNWGYGIATNSSNIYVAGYSKPAWDGFNHHPPLYPYAGDYDIFLLQLNLDGAYQWHTFYGQQYYDYAYGVVLYGSGDIYVAGSSQGGWNGPTGKPPIHTYTGGYDIVVLKHSK